MAGSPRVGQVFKQQVDALGRQREVVAAMGFLPALQARFTGLHDRVLVHQQVAQERAAKVSGLARAARLLIQAAAMGLGAMLVIDSDAHGVNTLSNIRYGVATARRAWVGPEQVANTREWPELDRLRKRSRR